MIRIVDGATLGQRIRTLAETEPDPGVITEKILSEIDYVEAQVIASLALREYVRHIVSRPAPAAPPVTYRTAAGETTVSAHVAAARDHTARLLAMSIQREDGAYIFLGDCGVNDLRYAAKSRYKKAEATHLEGVRHDRAANALVERGVTYVRHLPKEVIDEIYGR